MKPKRKEAVQRVHQEWAKDKIVRSRYCLNLSSLNTMSIAQTFQVTTLLVQV
jgi:hypothetical protein